MKSKEEIEKGINQALEFRLKDIERYKEAAWSSLTSLFINENITEKEYKELTARSNAKYDHMAEFEKLCSQKALDNI